MVDHRQLPIQAQREPLVRALRENPVVVVSGDTGSGKTTQLPQFCYEALRPRGRVACTQPRRVAAVSLAARVAQERQSKLGQLVGFQVRFQEATSESTRIQFMTDGILLAETRGDRLLRRYEVIIVDEAHERTLNIDFLLGYLHNLRRRRPDLKIVISSATLDVERFSAFFDGAPIVEIEGRIFPVDDQFLPPHEDEDLASHVARAVEWVRHRDRRGDILVFLPGEREIAECTDLLEGRLFSNCRVLPLFGRQSLKAQQAVFETSSEQRIVLATNVAETSVTIPGIVYVIDSGLVRVNRFDPRSQVQRLLTETVSQASARQRRGRCGRVSEGVCLHLYTEEQLQSRPLYTDPEIRRSSLAGVILQMKSLGLPAIEAFPFIDPPQRRLVSEGYRQLQDLDALDAERRLTETGRAMARLPLDPSLARMMIHASRHEREVLPDVRIIVAALSVQDPWERPRDKREEADRAHARWREPKSDFLRYLYLWSDLEAFRDAKTGRWRQHRLRRFCREHFLNHRRVLEWAGVHDELADLLKAPKGDTPSDRERLRESDYAPIHRCLLAGLPGAAAALDVDEKGYKTGDGRIFHIFPGSGMFGRKRRPPYAVGFEIVETSRLFARQAAAIDPAWLETVAPHLCRYRYSDPSWDSDQGAVYAREHVSCAGLRIVAGRRVHFGRTHPEEARKVFIWEALVRGDLRSTGAFHQHNQALQEAIRLKEQKCRRPDGLLWPEAMFDFFDRRLPREIHTSKAFERWRSEAEAAEPRLLFLEESDAVYPQREPFPEEAFPDEILHQGVLYPVYYRFAPGEPDDGFCLGCDIACLENLPDWLGDWLVPGMLEEKVGWLIRSLGKDARRICSPIEERADDFVRRTEPHGELGEALAAYLNRATGLSVRSEDFDTSHLPGHLRPSYWVGDEKGKELAVGTDLSELRERTRPLRTKRLQAESRDWKQTGRKRFPEEALPGEVVLPSGVAYPALVDEGEAVGVRCFHDAERAQTSHRLGLIRLAMLQWREHLDYVRKRFPLDPLTKRQLVLSGREGRRHEDDLLAVTIDAVLGGREYEAPDLRSRADFEGRLAILREKVFPAAERSAKQIDDVMQHYGFIAPLFEEHRQGPYAESVRDMEAQLEHLLAPGFLLVGWAERLGHYPRYLKGMRARLERMLAAPPAKDAQKVQRVTPYQRHYENLVEPWREQPLDIPFAVRRFGWQLEEFRLSVFTPEVAPVLKVSEKRLDAAIASLQGAGRPTGAMR